MRIALLGPVTVLATDGRPIPIGGPKVRTLLALLALDAGRVVPSADLIAALWGEEPPADTANALQTTVKRLRAALAPGAVIDGVQAGYRLAVDPEDVDALRFERLASEGAQALAAGDAPEAAEKLDEALRLWRGAALADLPDAASAAYPLEQERLTAVEARADAYLALNRSAELIGELTVEAAHHRLRETLIARLIRVLAAAGRRPEALDVYQRTRALLADELGVDPSPVLSDAYLDVLRAGDRQSATNLRPRLNSFVGRDREVERLDTALAGSRLLTLVGPGGAGKTRLACEAALHLAGRWPDGRWLVALAPLVDPAVVGNAVLAALGVPERQEGAAADPVERLAGVLAGRRVLLVMDNCEHVLGGAAPLIEELLARCPELTVLTTSREPLGIGGEMLYPVPPLALPPEGADAAQSAASAAVRLFADRAVAVRPDFVLDESTSATVAAICRRLDGLPLAIELAAAQMRAMTPAQVADRLGDRFRLLTGGSRTALPRHQTLRAVVAWSWDLLTDDERRLARRMAVFSGGATLEALEEVCEGDAAHALTALVDKSFVEVDGDRYRMLETIRVFAAEELAAAGETEAISLAHARHFQDLADRAEPELRTMTQSAWIVRLGLDHDNFTAALSWATGSGDGALALRLCGSLIWYWLLRGHRAEAEIWQQRVLAMHPDGPPPGLASAFLASSYAMKLPDYVTTARPDRVFGDIAAFEALYRRAESEERKPQPIFTVLRALAAAYQKGDHEPIDDCTDGDDAWVAGNAFLLRGSTLLHEGRHAAAAADLEAAVAFFRRAGEPRALVRALLALATYRVLSQGLASATPLVAEATALMTQPLGVEEAVASHVWLAILQAWDGAFAEAGDTLTRARARIPANAPADAVSPLSGVAADLSRRMGDPAAAIGIFDSLLASGSPQEWLNSGETWLRSTFALALIDVGDLDRAADELRLALLGVEAAWDLPLLVAVCTGFAALALARGDAARAAMLVAATSALAGDRGHTGHDGQRLAAEAEAALGPEEFGKAAAAGRDLSSDEVIRLMSTVVAATR